MHWHAASLLRCYRETPGFALAFRHGIMGAGGGVGGGVGIGAGVVSGGAGGRGGGGAGNSDCPIAVTWYVRTFPSAIRKS